MNIFALRELWNEKGADFKSFFYKTVEGIRTPLERLNHNSDIFLKREDKQPTGSLKIRTNSGILFLEKDSLSGKYISLASSGNFAKDLPYVLEKAGAQIKVKNFLSEKIAEENPELISKIKGEVITIKDEDYCPASRRKRGKAIAYAKAEEKFFKAKAFNQYEHIGAVFGNLLLGKEIYEQAGEDVTIAIGLGTGTSGLGIYYGYYFASGKFPDFFALLPQEEHHVLGLRSELEQGDSEFYKEIKSIAKEILKISDKEAFETMESLWNNKIPAGISTGLNAAGTEKIQNKTRKKVVTLMPDSIREGIYRTFLKKHFEKITGEPFNEHLYNSLQ